MRSTEADILVVDDDPQMRLALTEAIAKLGYSVEAVHSGYDAIERVRKRDYSLLITDMKMPDMDGLTLTRRVKALSAGTPVVVITAYGSIENAVEVLKAGAADYLMKPFSFEALGTTVESVMLKQLPHGEIVTDNPRMKKIVALCRELAATDITVLIYGESGTGKELLANFIHRASSRAGMPFVAVNCAAIPENLLESELFGHEKGAFTGATERREGKFELANGGTLLLDEVGEIPLGLQAKLLRVLQEKEIDRLGGRNPIPIDTRIIATTNRDLLRETTNGTFREDLYYRLSVFPIKVPPLRERPEDIPLLAEHFLRRFNASVGKNITDISPQARRKLLRHPWRGNVRELENAIQRAVFLCKGETLEEEHLMLDEPAAGDHAPAIIGGTVEDMERTLILKTLEEVRGNKTEAARLLGISVRTIRNKLKKYGKTFPLEEKFAG